eukprot:m51a1_g13052 hypothetical protein (232) ;mRNA; f:1216-2054
MRPCVFCVVALAAAMCSAVAPPLLPSPVHAHAVVYVAYNSTNVTSISSEVWLNGTAARADVSCPGALPTGIDATSWSFLALLSGGNAYNSTFNGCSTEAGKAADGIARVRALAGPFYAPDFAWTSPSDGVFSGTGLLFKFPATIQLRYKGDVLQSGEGTLETPGEPMGLLLVVDKWEASDSDAAADAIFAVDTACEQGDGASNAVPDQQQSSNAGSSLLPLAALAIPLAFH